jgi:hypothetical protein
MKKRKINLKQLSLKKSKVASLESNNVTGGFQSWTGTYEPCSFTDFDCYTVYGCPPPQYTLPNCPPPTPPVTQQNCTPVTDLCQSHSICPPGINCY